MSRYFSQQNFELFNNIALSVKSCLNLLRHLFPIIVPEHMALNLSYFTIFFTTFKLSQTLFFSAFGEPHQTNFYIHASFSSLFFRGKYDQRRKRLFIIPTIIATSPTRQYHLWIIWWFYLFTFGDWNANKEWVSALLHLFLDCSLTDLVAVDTMQIEIYNGNKWILFLYYKSSKSFNGLI